MPVPRAAVSAVATAIERALLTPAFAGWINAFRTPVLMDGSKAAANSGLGVASGSETLARRSRAPRARPALSSR